MDVVIHGPAELRARWRSAPRDETEPVARQPGHDLRWLRVLAEGLRHEPYLLEAVERRPFAPSNPLAARVAESTRGASRLHCQPALPQHTLGRLPLALVRSVLFGRFLVSLPYVSSSGVQAADPEVAAVLISRAAELARELDCLYLELRHEARVEHPALTAELASKVHMRLALPASVGALWDGLKAKVRNQVKKGQQQGFSVTWGGRELLRDFYAVFSRNMRDLGTPVYSRRLFEAMLGEFDGRAEMCVVRDGRRPVAAGVLIHGTGVTEVPSASSLRSYNPTNANMLLYWHLLSRSVERGQQVFDFGRSTLDGPVYRFKKQWGAEPAPAVWQYHVRRGTIDVARPDNPRHQRLIALWKRLPVCVSRWIGPAVVRGIP